jgi:MFS transporter, DHA1 family, multidrug resistance protein
MPSGCRLTGLENGRPPKNRLDAMKKHLFVLLACLFVVNIGTGITLPVLPFYTERLALEGGTATREQIAMHVGGLTGVYVLMQFFFAPLWGRWSDRVGRRLPILIGIAGYAASKLVFAVATTLPLLYTARVVGGILAAGILPAASAFVADVTKEDERGRGMAWLGAAASLGLVVGPALGGLAARRDFHFSARYGHLLVDSFSVPFLIAALLALLAFLAALWRLPETLRRAVPVPQDVDAATAVNRREARGALKLLLGFSLVGQFGLAIFEATFALYAKQVMGYETFEIGAVFVVCGLVMALFQVGVAGFLTERVGEIIQTGAGLALTGASLLLLARTHATPLVLIVVGLLALGVALFAPNLASLISKRGGERTGAALGTQTAANNLGQAAGPLLGGLLFAWRADAPYLLAGALLLIAGGVAARSAFDAKKA